MSHILILKEWETSPDHWHVADTSDLVNNSAFWAHPMRMLGLSPVEYVKLLKEKYHAINISFKTAAETGTNSMLHFCFSTQQDAHRFALDINRIARNKKWEV